MKQFTNLLKLAEKLRSETGCPWDRSRTLENMSEPIANEAKEVDEAFAKKDYENLKEELGDVLFNIVLIAQIAKENKKFSIEDVIAGVDKKIRERHTWVFGKDKAKTAEEALEMWKVNKQKKKNVDSR